MKIIRLPDSFNCYYLAVFIQITHFFCTCTRQLAIKNYRARAAHSYIAAYLGSRKSHPSENIGKRILFRIAGKHPVGSVDIEPHFFKLHNRLLLIL